VFVELYRISPSAGSAENCQAGEGTALASRGSPGVLALEVIEPPRLGMPDRPKSRKIRRGGAELIRDLRCEIMEQMTRGWKLAKVTPVSGSGDTRTVVDSITCQNVAERLLDGRRELLSGSTFRRPEFVTAAPLP
jgi:hypothetical protein